MLKKNGFYLLVPMGSEEGVDIDILEKKYNLQLPPLYKLFAQTYHLGKDRITRDRYLDINYNDYFNLISYYFSPNPEIGFSHFNEVIKSFEIWDSKYLPNIMYEKKYFPVAPANFGGIYLALSGTDKDKIVYDNGEDSSFEVIADNIFEFVKNIHIELVKPEFLYSKFNYDQLYKNWGEDFWRIREDKSE